MKRYNGIIVLLHYICRVQEMFFPDRNSNNTGGGFMYSLGENVFECVFVRTCI